MGGSPDSGVADSPVSGIDQSRRTLLRGLLAAAVSAPAASLGWHASALARTTTAFKPNLFTSFFLAGFECSTHRRRDGKRLDVIASTQHDRFAVSDYRRVAQFGMRSVRDGLRWHLIEQVPGHYDWSSFLPMLRAARETGTQVIWDLSHYGWPDHLDIWSPAFVDSFARFAGAAARVVREETGTVPFYVPINEISFWAWAGGDVGYLNPFRREMGPVLKDQLVRAAIAGMEAVWAVDRRARFVHAEPMINEVAAPSRPQDKAAAEARRLSQFEAWDLLCGRLRPELGGKPAYLDILGANYYSNNQRIWRGRILKTDDPLYRPFSELLIECYRRYERPIFIAETGIEFEGRPAWLRYVGAEARTAMAAGVPLEGICLYPILNHPGWDDDRHTQGGLLDYPDETGYRPAYEPLAKELQVQQQSFERTAAKNGVQRL